MNIFDKVALVGELVILGLWYSLIYPEDDIDEDEYSE